MKSLLAFIRKEMLEQRRSGKLIILGILFIIKVVDTYLCTLCCQLDRDGTS